MFTKAPIDDILHLKNHDKTHMEQLTQTSIWKALETHAQSRHLFTLQNLNQLALAERQAFNVSACNIYLDYSKQHLTKDTLALLIELADARGLRERIHDLIQGKNVNSSENRPALHTALRAQDITPIRVNHQDIMPDIIATRHTMRLIVDKIRMKNWLGFSGKPITDLVNIGIGGSDLGPRFALKALDAFTTKDLNYHFISDADPNRFNNAVDKLNPETTLFIVSSKSFTTHETIYNVKKAIDWIGADKAHEQHFIAVTAHAEKAHALGIKTVLPLWDWVGGRYSFCSSVNLITAIAIGFEQFNQLLKGANSMDKHFQESDFSCNLPVILALIGIWNNNFLHIHTLLTWTYGQSIDLILPYLQQLDMESNGKSIDKQGRAVNYPTGPILWGGIGNQAQHSYYQLLCQGTHKITADFISLNAHSGHIINNVCDAKIQVLTAGSNNRNNPNGYIPGNTPINHLRISNYSPFTLGALIALYEHKVYTQSVIWDINPFDQPAVESAKWSSPNFAVNPHLSGPSS